MLLAAEALLLRCRDDFFSASFRLTVCDVFRNRCRQQKRLLQYYCYLISKTGQLQLTNIDTRDVLLNITPRTASTLAEVSIVQAGSRLDAIGMNLDMINEHYELLDAVRAHYEID